MSVMSMPARYPLILNPRAKSERARKALRFVMDHATRFAIYATNSPEEARDLAGTFADAGEKVVVAAGERGTSMYLVASGALEVRGAGDLEQLSNGDFFGELALFMPHRRRRTSVVSIGFCRLLTLSRRDFLRLTRKDPTIETLLRRAAEEQLGKEYPVIPNTVP